MSSDETDFIPTKIPVNVPEKPITVQDILNHGNHAQRREALKWVKRQLKRKGKTTGKK